MNVCKRCGGVKEEKSGGIAAFKSLFKTKIKLILENRTGQQLYGAFYVDKALTKIGGRYELESAIIDLPPGEKRIEGPAITALRSQRFFVTSDRSTLTSPKDNMSNDQYIDIGGNVFQRYLIDHEAQLANATGRWDSGLLIRAARFA